MSWMGARSCLAVMLLPRTKTRSEVRRSERGKKYKILIWRQLSSHFRVPNCIFESVSRKKMMVAAVARVKGKENRQMRLGLSPKNRRNCIIRVATTLEFSYFLVSHQFFPLQVEGCRIAKSPAPLQHPICGAGLCNSFPRRWRKISDF